MHCEVFLKSTTHTHNDVLLMRTHNIYFHGEIIKYYLDTILYLELRVLIFANVQGPAVQTIASLMSLLITIWLTILPKVFSNTLIFLLQKCE